MKNHNRHILKLRNIADKDFGNYTCRAENKLGIANKVMEISGKRDAFFLSL